MKEYKILDILLILFSTQIVNKYFKAFQESIKNKNMKWIAWGIYVSFQYGVMNSHASSPLYTLGINVMMVFCIYKSSHHVSTKNALFRAGFFYAIWMLVEVATNNILQLSEIKDSDYFFVVGNIVSKIAMYLVVIILNHYRKTNLYLDLPFHYWIRLFLIPIATFYIIYNTYCITISGSNRLFFTITTISMILINYIAFDLYDSLGNYAETEKKNLAYAQQIILCNKQSAEREAAYQDTRRTRHNLNSYLIDLKATVQAKNIIDSITKIDSMLEYNKVYKNEISCSGNIIIDSLINYKFSVALKEKIYMKCYVFVPEQMPFDGADMCIILGNLLDNAIEAVAYLPEKKRNIDVSIQQVKGNLSITVQNPFVKRITQNEIGQFLTSKRDSINHGIGLESVQRTVAKYNGELLIDKENNLFRVTILMYPLEGLHGYI